MAGVHGLHARARRPVKRPCRRGAPRNGNTAENLAAAAVRPHERPAASRDSRIPRRRVLLLRREHRRHHGAVAERHAAPRRPDRARRDAVPLRAAGDRFLRGQIRRWHAETPARRMPHGVGLRTVAARARVSG